MFIKQVLLYYILIIQNVSPFRTNDNIIYYIIDNDIQNRSRLVLKFNKTKRNK